MLPILDGGGAPTPCPKPADFPHVIHSATGAYVDGAVLVCAGFDDDTFEYSSACYAYDFVKEAWGPGPAMMETRLRSMSVMLDEVRWWVTGGAAGEEGPRDSTEIYQVDCIDYSNLIFQTCTLTVLIFNRKKSV